MVDEKRCETCRFWSKWMPRSGDCMEYAYKRRDAVLRGDKDVPPPRSAEMTDQDDRCDKWEADDDA